MAEDVARVVLHVIGLYLAIGAALTPPFLIKGLRVIDPTVRNGTLGFHLIVVPGIVTLWPLLLIRWMGRSRGIMR